MKLPHGRRAHEGAKSAWRSRSAWLWMRAFRRQQHQGATAALSGLDATEQHITELYTKAAIEQLDSDQAPVRFGALCALERLAQDNPAHRQTIVNVMCAYLRMPFSPTAPASNPGSEAAEGQESPGTESETEADGTGGTWQQERQVRLTAQRIIAEHLRNDGAKDQQSNDPLGSRFWTNIRLDLSGATLIDFDLVNGAVAAIDFHGAAFSGDASFNGATFGGIARFGGATFGGDARFGGATFGGDASFPEATFRRDALFGEANFRRVARFRSAAFGGLATFQRAAFGGDASFEGATFIGDAGFGEAVFGGDVWFGKVAFGGDASFEGATFIGDAGFGEAVFGGDVWFGKVAFRRGVSFEGATFTGDARFDETAFTGGAGFGEAVFAGDAWFDKATFRRGASFDEAAFSGVAGFGEAAFTGGVWFGEATFTGGADALHFEQARILSPRASHMWPTGWCLADADGGGYAVVRANDDGGS